MASTAATDTSNLTDSFNKAAGTYECRMGSATRSVAQKLVSLLPLNTSIIHDNACGTGAVTEAFLYMFQEGRVEATDASDGMVSIMHETIDKRHWQQQVNVKTMDSVKLDFSDNTFDATIMNFGIFFTSDPIETAKEIRRTLKDGGVGMITCWKEGALFSLIFDVQALVKPAHSIRELEVFEKWKDPNTLRSVMKDAGFLDVELQDYPVTHTCATLSKLAESITENMKGIIGSQWSEQEKSLILPSVEKILKEQSLKYLAVDKEDCKGIAWTAWIAIASK